MRALIALLLSLWLAPAWAQLPMTGAGKGTPGGVTYQGPGDVFTTSPYAAYSCARVFTAALATTSTNLCDLVASTGGAAVCTLRGSSTGYVDQSAYCGGLSPSAACAAASGGSCKISKAYDQTGNGRDVVQGTLASMPAIAFSSPGSGSLPVIACSGSLLLQSSSTYTQAQPITASTVYIRSTGTAFGGVIGANSGSTFAGAGASANQATVEATSGLNATASDNNWHALNTLANGNGTSSAINVDGSDTTGAAGTTGLSANSIRLCRANGQELLGSIAEAWLWAASSTSTDRGNLSTNQHSSANGYNF